MGIKSGVLGVKIRCRDVVSNAVDVYLTLKLDLNRWSVEWKVTSM